MDNRKINIARIWSKYEGQYDSRAGVIMGLDPQQYITICIYLAKNSKKSNLLEAKGYKTIYISENQSLQRFNFLLVWKLVKIIKTEKIDILHCHRHKSTVYGTIAAMIARTPVVIAHIHGLDRTRNWQRRFKNFFLMKKISKILTVGEAVRDDVLKNNIGVPTEKVYSLVNSIDYGRFAHVSTTKESAKRRIGLSPDSFIFGTVGRLVPTKGQVYLINAFSKVKQLIPSAELILVGDGCLRKQLGKQAAETLYADSIHFLGYRADIPELLKAMDVFVLSSIAEGIPKSILEAMSAGIPCVATEVGGIPDVICNSDIGYMVPPKDSNALAEAMIELVKMPQKERQKLIDNARQKVYSCHSHRVVVRKLENIYETELAHYYESNRRQKSNV